MSNQVISSWDVYWVMQLDSIVGWLTALVIAGGIVSIIALIVGALMRGSVVDENDPDYAMGVATHRACRKAAYPLCAALALVMLLPSSKTAAAMIVLPAIANNQAIQREAGDLYAMAKQALADAAGIKPKAEERRDD